MVFWLLKVIRALVSRVDSIHQKGYFSILEEAIQITGVFEQGLAVKQAGTNRQKPTGDVEEGFHRLAMPVPIEKILPGHFGVPILNLENGASVGEHRGRRRGRIERGALGYSE